MRRHVQRTSQCALRRRLPRHLPLRLARPAGSASFSLPCSAGATSRKMNPPRPLRDLPPLSGRTHVKRLILMLGIAFGTLPGIDCLATERLTYATGAHVISVGDSMARVIEFMGDPTSKE